ncbi:MAG TPA: hypothetical protein VFU36_02970 [Jatrophihabitans sp.]|nr:hypothetical protein [Jatrophihabitans sp.]
MPATRFDGASGTPAWTIGMLFRAVGTATAIAGPPAATGHPVARAIVAAFARARR